MHRFGILQPILCTTSLNYIHLKIIINRFMKVQRKIENYKFVNANQNSNEFFLFTKTLEQNNLLMFETQDSIYVKKIAIII
jgi:hypothetical protein